MYLKPNSVLEIESKDKVYVLCPKKPTFSFYSLFLFFHLPIVNQPSQQTNNVNFYETVIGNSKSLKTKLTGDEGRKDIEMAKQLQGLNNEIKEISN